jgi:hypothetical protein
MAMPAKTGAVFDYLKKCASEMRTVTYGEIAQKHGMGKGLAVRYALGYIRDGVCLPRGLPWLNALAVNATTRRPGDSFLPSGITFGKGDERLWRGMVLHVFGFDWDAVKL